jgi:hypothetical protein
LRKRPKQALEVQDDGCGQVLLKIEKVIVVEVDVAQQSVEERSVRQEEVVAGVVGVDDGIDEGEKK